MFSGFHSLSINNLSTLRGLSLYSLIKIKICQIIQMCPGLVDCSKLGWCNNCETREYNVVQIGKRVWGVEPPNQGGYYEATSDPPLWSVTWWTKKATLSEWKSKRSQKLSKKMSKCANFTITAAKWKCKKHALCRQYHHLSTPSKTAWYQKNTRLTFCTLSI